MTLEKNTNQNEYKQKQKKEALISLWAFTATALMLLLGLKYSVSIKKNTLAHLKDTLTESPFFQKSDSIDKISQINISDSPALFVEYQENMNRELVNDFYQNLLTHEGKSIYLIYTTWCPTDQIFYCFSEQELKILLEDFEKEKKQLEKDWKNCKIIGLYSTVDSVQKVLLNEEKIFEILRYQSKHPLLEDTREYWETKLTEFLNMRKWN